MLTFPPSLRLRDRQRTERQGHALAHPQPANPASCKGRKRAEGEQREAEEEGKGGESGSPLSAWPQPPPTRPCLAPPCPSVNTQGSTGGQRGGGGQSWGGGHEVGEGQEAGDGVMQSVPGNNKKAEDLVAFLRPRDLRRKKSTTSQGSDLPNTTQSGPEH